MLRKSIHLLLLAAAILGPDISSGRGADGGEYLVLETADPAGDGLDALRPADPYPGGDLRGARLVLKKIPITRGPETAPSRPDHVYIPVELTIFIDQTLSGGEVQLCIFSHLPPLHIEHILSRDSIILDGAQPGERVVLKTRSAISLFTGMEESWDLAIEEFKASPAYQNCFFEAAPEDRGEGLRLAAKFNIHSGATYIFPPSPRFFWRDIPPLSVSTSLVVRELDGLTAGPVRSLVSDTLKSSWRETTER